MSEHEYLSAGYYLALPKNSSVISASECRSSFFPDTWAIGWSSDSAEERTSQAASFGIPAQALPAATAWATQAFGTAFGWPNTFYTLAAAREARHKFIANAPQAALFGLGLHNTLVKSALDATHPEPPKPGCAPTGETGIFQCLNAQTPIEPGGEFLGFEPLSLYFGLLTCSWRCNGLDAESPNRPAIQTNPHGLIASFEDAIRCTDWIAQSPTRAEPGLWLPWRITLYSA